MFRTPPEGGCETIIGPLGRDVERPEGASTVIGALRRDVMQPFGPHDNQKNQKIQKFLIFFDFFCFYSLANGQLMVRESGPFVRRSSKH
jgi:hypothetical protein